MNTAADFLRTIIEKPADDGPRLIYADWLEEQGDTARAEFIRTQCELARIGHNHPDNSRVHEFGSVCPQCHQLILQEKELLRRHVGGWTDGLPECLITRQCPSCEDAISDWETNAVECRRCEGSGLAEDYDRVEFHRGFVSHITITAAEWLIHADALRAATPLERVTLTTCWDPYLLEYSINRWAFFHPEVPPRDETDISRYRPAERVFRHLKGGRLSVPLCKWYDGHAEAMVDLTRAIHIAFPGIAFDLPLPREINLGTLPPVDARGTPEFQRTLDEIRIRLIALGGRRLGGRNTSGES